MRYCINQYSGLVWGLTESSLSCLHTKHSTIFLVVAAALAKDSSAGYEMREENGKEKGRGRREESECVLQAQSSTRIDYKTKEIKTKLVSELNLHKI